MDTNLFFESGNHGDFKKVMQEYVPQLVQCFRDEVMTQGWCLLTEAHNLQIYQQCQENTGLNRYLCRGRLQGEGVSARSFFDMNMDLEYRKEWDEYVKDLKVVNVDKDGHELIHWTVKFPWPLADRDYVYRRDHHICGSKPASSNQGTDVLSSTPDDCVYVIVSSGCAHDEVPEVSSVVRVETYTSIMLMSPVTLNKEDVGPNTGAAAETDSTPQACDFFMLYFDDLRGSIPSFLMNWAVGTGIPKFIDEMCAACAKHASWKSVHHEGKG